MQNIIVDIYSLVSDILSNNGPEPIEYPFIIEVVDMVPPNEVDKFRDSLKPILHPGTIIGFSFTKPFGYNGDFFIIEKIYQKYINPAEDCRKWDMFFHYLPAAVAVVNRKQLAIEQFTHLNESKDKEPKEILILGSGPANEVHEYLGKTLHNNLRFDLIDLDKRAIEYARSKNRDYLDVLKFMNHNVIRFIPEKKYDMIWSAGLFDYFKDKHFVYLIKKYHEHLKPGGEMIIGNFNINNPSRKIMEILGDWFLFHRSEDELQQFALQAGIKKRNIRVISEPLGINLFLKILR